METQSEKGQAIFEFIIFLPFFLTMLFIMIAVSGSINASINQNKSTRGYFYASVRGNSMVPTTQDLQGFKASGLTSVGMYSFGWREKGSKSLSYAPCFKLPVFIGSGKVDEACDNAIPSGHDGSSRFIKVLTAYGVCSAPFTLNDQSGEFEWANLAGASVSATCTMR